MQAQASPASFTVSQHPKAACTHDHGTKKDHENEGVLETLEALGAENKVGEMELLVVIRLLKQQFGQVEIDMEKKMLTVTAPSGVTAIITGQCMPWTVSSDDEALQKHVISSIRKLESALGPLSFDVVTSKV